MKGLSKMLRNICIGLYVIYMYVYIAFLHSDEKSKVYKVIKKIIPIFGIALLIFIMYVVIMQTDVKAKESKDNSTISNYTTEQTFYYKQTATAINERMFQTEDGNIWIMKNVQLEKNEKYEITFDNHDTEIITDDEIVDFVKLNEKG
jgi:amino acid transporter